MAFDLPILHIARAVLEARTPLSICTGNPDGVFDTALVRDANNLPAIPASSLAGILRSRWTEEFGASDAAIVFGCRNGEDGANSRAQINWGSLLDSNGRAACGLLLGAGETRLRDPIYAEALRQIDEPVFRSRVRLARRRAAAETGPFDRAVLPAGNRFAVELRLTCSADEDETRWHRLLAQLTHPELRLGGAARAGLGRMECLSVHAARFDLRDPIEARGLSCLGADPSETAGMRSRERDVASAGWIDTHMALQLRGMWRIGQGYAPLDQDVPDRATDLLPVTERRVLWESGRGRVSCDPELLLPAASLKGVLAHRAAFHANRFAGKWASAAAAGSVDREVPREVRALFGDVRIRSSGDGTRGGARAGCLFLDDGYLPVEQHIRVTHNVIDRFTGGTREHRLFEEQNALAGETPVRIAIDVKRLARAAADLGTGVEDVQKAFIAALHDLCDGRLALGARSTSGNGFVHAAIPHVLRRPWTDALERPEARL